jgi:hypothetical protein
MILHMQPQCPHQKRGHPKRAIPGNNNLRTRNPDGTVRGVRNLRVVYRARRMSDVEAYVLVLVPGGISPGQRLARETDA